jgi:hypothetical protein
LKVVSEWKYEGKYISVETWEFVDTPSTNHDSDQDNDQADNPKDNNINNQSAEKKTSSYTDLLNELKDIWNKEIVYKPNENTTFNFTEKGCRLETSGKVINFKKRGSWLWYYTADIGDRKGDAYMYMRDKFIYIYRVSLRPIKKLYYPSWAEFEWKCDERGILEEWIMTNSDGTPFEWSFIFNEKTQTVKQWEPHKVNIENLGRFWD